MTASPELSKHISGVIGADYLTYLWLYEQCARVSHLDEYPTFRIEGPLVFESSYGDANQVTVKGDHASESKEAFLCAASGKRLVQATVIIAATDILDISATVNGKTLAISGLTPQSFKGTPEEVATHRINYIQVYAKLLIAHMESFMAQRDSKAQLDTIDVFRKLIRHQLEGVAA